MEPGTWSEQSERLWEVARGEGMPRRQFLALLVAGGAAAVLAACGGRGSSSVSVTGGPVSTADPAALFKDPTPFIQRGASLESRLELMPGLITPNDLFFVRNNSTSVDLSVDRLVADCRRGCRRAAPRSQLRRHPPSSQSLVDRLSGMRRQPPGDVRPIAGPSRRRYAVGSGRHWQRRLDRRLAGRCADFGGIGRRRRQRVVSGAGRGFARGGLPAGSAAGKGPGHRHDSGL